MLQHSRMPFGKRKESPAMLKMPFAPVAVLVALLSSVPTANSQDPPGNGIYAIKSGDYREDGGFVGSLTYPLPNAQQAFVSLARDSGTAVAELKILDESRKNVFLHLTNGIVSGNTIRFQYLTAHPYGPDLPVAWVDYTVTNHTGSLSISGSITSSPVCCDIPYLFAHEDGRTSFVPSLTIRFSGRVELCWNSVSNQNYQVQYHPDVIGASWSDLGPAVQGDGSTHCVTDDLIAGQTRRFYRLVSWP